MDRNAIRAQSHPNANFPGPLADVVTDDAVNTDRGERERDEGEKREDPHVEAASATERSSRCSIVLMSKAAWVGSISKSARCSVAIISSGAIVVRTTMACEGHGVLPIREIHFRHRRLIQSGVMDRANDPDNRRWSLGLEATRETQMLSDRVFVREELPDELLVHHRDWRRVRIVAFRETAAGLERDAERSKVAVGDNPKLGERTLFGGLGSSFDRERHWGARGIEGKEVDRAGRLHSGQITHPLQDAVVKCAAFLDLCPRQRELHRQDVFATKTRVDALDPKQTFDEQTGTDREENSEPDLADEEETAQAIAALTTRGAQSALAQSGVEIGPRSFECRRQTGNEAGRGREAKREEKNEAINPDFAEPRNTRVARRDEQIDSPVGDENSRETSDQGEDNAFEKQLPDELTAARPEREPDSHFAPARFCPHELQTGDVDTGDEQDEANRAEEESKAARAEPIVCV